METTLEQAERVLRRIVLATIARRASEVQSLTPMAPAEPSAGEAHAPVPEGPAEPADVSLELIPGGFALGGQARDLTGRARAMLCALLESSHRRCTVAELRETIGIDDEAVTYPEQAIKDTAKSLRAELKKAAAAAGLPCENPLPSKGRGKELTYILAMP
jgi:hypothetical protein